MSPWHHSSSQQRWPLLVFALGIALLLLPSSLRAGREAPAVHAQPPAGVTQEEWLSIQAQIRRAESQSSEIAQLIASDGAANDNFGYAVAISGDTIVVGAWTDDVGSNLDQGSAYVFERNQGGADNWGQVTKLTASDGTPDDRFGYSVAISGDTLVVGAYQDNVGSTLDQGSAYLFERNQGGTNNWGQVTQLTAADGAANDRFGYAVAISGDTLVVGTPEDNVGSNPDQGSAYLFERNQGGVNNWGQVAHLTASDGVANDRFGVSVAISGDALVVGAPEDNVGSNPDQGSTYLFERNQGGADAWGQVTQLTASDGAASDRFGHSVAISGDTIVVGAWQDNMGSSVDQGSAYLFERNQGGANSWGQVTQFTASDGEASDRFGVSVAISGDTVVVGASQNNVGSNFDQGSTYLFERDQGGIDAWGLVTQLTAADGAAADLFGWSVAISGDTPVVGAWQDDVGSSFSQGSAYVYRLDPLPTPTPTNTPSTPTGTTTPTNMPTATNTATATRTATVGAASSQLYLPLMIR